MATKLNKNYKKLKVILIVLCILLPAFVTVALYPMMEDAMLTKKAEYKKIQEEYYDEYLPLGEEYSYVLPQNTINYAVEASYYVYSVFQKEDSANDVNQNILEEYGWINDYYAIRDSTRYLATYTKDGGEKVTKTNSQNLKDGIATLMLVYDSKGEIERIDFESDSVCMVIPQHFDYLRIAQRSVEQYCENVKSYAMSTDSYISETQMQPKNFSMVIQFDEESAFINTIESWKEMQEYYMPDSEHLYVETGAHLVVIACGIFVMLMALLLPFWKRLETGKEKIFSLPLELAVALGTVTFFCLCGMYFEMSHCTMSEMKERLASAQDLAILGKTISVSALYYLRSAADVIGWSVCFLLEYIVVASIRPLLTSPVFYIKNRILVVSFLRRIVKQIKNIYKYVTDIDISQKLNQSIIKIVIANFVILTVLCCMWLFGIAGLVVYSVGLYILLKKYGEKIQKQYNSILHATEQMAEGNLMITMEEDLGIFASIGKSLEQVQQGFEKAVLEEAKSQNMKTELITNVSHDLKTPLTAIITYVDLLKNEDLTEEERNSYIKTLEQKSQRLKVLIEDLFEVSKAQSGNVNMNFMEVDIVNLLRQIKSEMAEVIEKSNLTFRWNLPEEKVILLLDGQRTYRVFENLLNNALKYAMPYTRVYVDVIDGESDVQITFRNISAAELSVEAEQLTERFVRGDVSRNSEGSGLGLAIAKSFVELQNGELKISVDGDLFKVEITWSKKQV